jgi:hypothetical protein
VTADEVRTEIERRYTDRVQCANHCDDYSVYRRGLNAAAAWRSNQLAHIIEPKGAA